jgi:hypothetical protein
MKILRPLLAVSLVLLCALSFAHAADVRVERPFGGPPPPKSRGTEPATRGSLCKTPTVTCKLKKPQRLGRTCSCPRPGGEPVTGKVVEQ